LSAGLVRQDLDRCARKCHCRKTCVISKSRWVVASNSGSDLGQGIPRRIVPSWE
jgi:hypothetical protein